MDTDPSDTTSSLIDENLTSSSTDVVTDLKVGIYNLFVSLFHQYAAFEGPEQAIVLSTAFLDEIVVNFRSALPDNNPDENFSTDDYSDDNSTWI